MKESLITHLKDVEQLLLLIDQRMYWERVNLVKLLHYVCGGIEDRENYIKELLANIALLEMAKSREEDSLSEQTLKTIEIVNINDIDREIDNLEKLINQLNLKKNDLQAKEDDLLREQKRREDKRKRGGLNIREPSSPMREKRVEKDLTKSPKKV